ncbi:MAG: GNAT family N-acetyltransferase [Sphingomonadales bacterium]|nr:GNAT family N-acetyltransferase [Sphingomonadales bacterium]
MNDLRLQRIPFAGTAYALSIALRHTILRAQLGLHFSLPELQAEQDQIHLGAWVGHELIGCLVLAPVDLHTIRMRQVAVRADRQLLGVGTALVRYSEEVSREHFFDTLTLHARRTAVPFYQKLGYREDPQEFMEVGIPHIRMWLPLEN